MVSLNGILETAAIRLQEELHDQATEILAHPWGLDTVAGLCGDAVEVTLSAYLTTEFKEAEDLAKNIFKKIAKYVGAGVEDTVTDIGEKSAVTLPDRAVEHLFQDYLISWRNGVAEAVSGSTTDDNLKQMVDAIKPMCLDSAATTDTYKAAMLAPLLQLGATTAAATDPFGAANGIYEFRLGYTSGEDAENATATVIALPTAVPPEDQRLLHKIPGVLETQTFQATSEDGTISFYVDPRGRSGSRGSIPPAPSGCNFKAARTPTTGSASAVRAWNDV